LSSVDQHVDLSGLSRGEPSLEPPRRSWLRTVVPLALLGTFAFILRDAIAEMLLQRIPVTLTRPVLLTDSAASTPTQRTLLTQAAAWYSRCWCRSPTT